MKIGQLQVSNVKAANVRLEIKAADGKLDVAPPLGQPLRRQPDGHALGERQQQPHCAEAEPGQCQHQPPHEGRPRQGRAGGGAATSRWTSPPAARRLRR
ncbi:MAG: hypothetical protein M5R42_13270 [Rhodocyclaceae bacterium]|nr:hypothetical protein [Rhodocyclaceae bacterium]